MFEYSYCMYICVYFCKNVYVYICLFVFYDIIINIVNFNICFDIMFKLYILVWNIKYFEEFELVRFILISIYVFVENKYNVMKVLDILKGIIVVYWYFV